MTLGHFIVLEGIDGAGTTTHARLLARRLKDAGVRLHPTREPSDGPVGTLIRQILQGRVGVPRVEGLAPPSWMTMALLFAADRRDHLEAEIVPRLAEGTWVLSDRYVHSSVAYQGCAAPDAPDAPAWVKELNRTARSPDLTVVLDVPADVAARRRAARTGPPDLFEDDALQERLAAYYANIEDHFPDDPIVHIDGDRDRDDVADAIFAAVVAELPVPGAPAAPPGGPR